MFESDALSQDAYELEKPTVHGELDDGTPATLWAEGFHPVQDRDGGGDDKQAWKRTVTQALLGAHLGGSDTTLFTRTAVRFENLGMWSRHPDIVPADAPAPEFRPAQIAPYDEGYEVSVSLENPQIVRQHPDGSQRIGVETGQDAQIVFTSPSGAPLKFHDHLIYDAQGLLTFCYQDRAHVTAQFGLADGQEVRIYRRRPIRPLKRRLSGAEMIVTANTSEPATLFLGWWAAATAYYPLPQILAGRYYTRRAFTESHVSSAIAALEAVYEHLSHLPQTYMDPGRFEERKEWHLDQEDDLDFQTVLQALSNRVTLRRKLKALGNDLGPLLGLAGISLKTWVEDVMEVRDLLAHTGSHVSGVSDTAGSMLDLVDRNTRAVLSLVLCRLIGVTGPALNRAADILGRHGPFAL